MEPGRKHGKANSFVSFKMAYQRLRRRNDDGSGPIMQIEMEDVEGTGVEAEDDVANGPVGETPTRAPEVESRLSDDNDDESVDVDVKEDEKKLIDDEIDESGVARDYEVALKHLGFGLFHVFLVLINGMALSSDAIEILSISFVLPIIKERAEFDIADWQNALLGSIIFLGMLFGSYFWGTLSDLSGRRFTLLMSLTVNGVFGLCSAFAPNYYVFLVLRFVSGFGVGGSLPVIFSYMSEYIRNKYRGPYLALQSTFWMVGTLLCGAFAWLIIPQHHISAPMGSITIHSWRVFIAVSAVPSLLGAVLYLILPESPRYLLEVGKEEKALKALRLAYRYNHLREKNPQYPVKAVALPPVAAEDGSRWKLKCCGRSLYNLDEVLHRTRELYQRKLLRRTLLLSVILFCLSFGSYGVTLWYPTYVRNINQQKDNENFEKFCSQPVNNATISAESLQEYCGCNNTVFTDVVFSQLEISDWGVNATFENVTFREVNFSNVIFQSTVFSGCSMEDVRFDSVQFIDTVWNSSSLSGIRINSSEFCGYETHNFTSLEEITATNVSLNGRTAALLNETTFPQLLDRAENASCSMESAPVINCDKEDHDTRVYKDNFLISASALPGNIIAGIAVYFFRRNYWMTFTLLCSMTSVFLLYVVHSEVFVVVILCVFTALSTPSWNDSSLLITELYPTHLRSTAMGVHLLMGRIGAITGINLFGEFVNINPNIPILLVAGVLFIGAIAAIPLPKTTRKTLLT